MAMNEARRPHILCKVCRCRISRITLNDTCYPCYEEKVRPCLTAAHRGHNCSRCGTTQAGYCRCQKGTFSG